MLSPLQGVEDHIHDAGSVAQHIAVPKAEHMVAARFEPTGAFRITLFSLSVLAAVDFDRELRRQTYKIDDEGADRMLTAKSKSLQLSTS